MSEGISQDEREKAHRAILEGWNKRSNLLVTKAKGASLWDIPRARYRGRWRVAIQVFMTFIVMNSKRMVKLLEIKQNSVSLALPSG